MKKLGKLSISPEKIMRNEELINLQGGHMLFGVAVLMWKMVSIGAIIFVTPIIAWIVHMLWKMLMEDFLFVYEYINKFAPGNYNFPGANFTGNT